MPADEAAVRTRGSANRALGRADVGDDTALRRQREHLAHLGRKLGHGCRDEHQLDAVERFRDRPRGLHRLALGSDRKRVRVRVPAGDPLQPGTAGGERSGRADQTPSR